MQKPKYRSALIVGTGPGLSASLARLFTQHGLAVSVAARRTDRLAALVKATGASPCLRRRRSDGGCRPVRDPGRQHAHPTSWSTTRATACAAPGRAGARRRQARHRDQRLRRLPGRPAGRPAHAAQSHGAIFLTGATAGVKGFALSATFAMGKFALRGLAQSMARELPPRASTSPTSSSTAGSEVAPVRCRTTRPTACSTPTPSPRPTGRPAAAPQRLELGGRGPAVGGEVLVEARRWSRAPTQVFRTAGLQVEHERARRSRSGRGG